MVFASTVTIAGNLIDKDVERIKVRKSISENNSTGSFEITMENTNGRHAAEFSIGDTVVIETVGEGTGGGSDFPWTFPITFGGSVNLISGTISEILFRGKGSVKETLILKGRDFTELLQDSTVSPAIFKDQDVATIVNSIISDNVPDVTTNNVNPTATTIDSLRFNHVPVFDALRQLARESNSFFFVDADKDLNFITKGSLSSSLRFDTTNITESSFMTVDRELANNVFVYGSRRLSGWQEDFTGDGGSIFQLDFNPHNTNVFVGGSDTPKQGGVFEFSSAAIGSPIQYLTDFDLSRIIFVSGTDAGNNIPVSGTDAIEIKYEREIPIVKFGIDRISQASFGKKQLVVVDKNITDPRQAVDRVNLILLEQSSPILEGTISVNNIVDVTPGQLVTVDMPTENVNEQTYEVLEVNYDIDRKNELGNNITTIKVNKRIINILDTIKQLKLDIQQLQADDSTSTEFLTRLESAIGNIGLQRQWEVKTRTIGNSFVLSHPINGIIGSPQLGVNNAQLTLGSASASAFTTVKSGGDF